MPPRRVSGPAAPAAGAYVCVCIRDLFGEDVDPDVLTDK